MRMDFDSIFNLNTSNSDELSMSSSLAHYRHEVPQFSTRLQEEIDGHSFPVYDVYIGWDGGDSPPAFWPMSLEMQEWSLS